MRTQDIKNMATAMQQVAENQKAALAKKLARAGASSEKGKAAVSLPKAPWDKKEAVEDEAKPIKLRGFGPDHKKASGSSLKKMAGMEEAADLDKSNVDKALIHDCATHVEHANWGKGQPISEQHTIVESAPGVGYVTHYDVMFEHGIEKNVSVKDLDILSEMSHGHSKKKKKNEAIAKEGMSSKEKMKKGLYNSKMDPVDKKELKGTHDDRDDKDIDNDGDADKSDKYLHNRRKAISKNVNSGDKSEVEMNPKMKKDKKSPAAGEQMEGTVYARILEKRDAHYKKAAAPETMDDKLKGKGAKDMADDMTLKTADKISNYDELGHDDAAKAGRSGPSKKNRRNDNDKGDKKAIPSATPTKGT